MAEELTDREFTQLRDFIYRKCGIFFNERDRYRLAYCLKKRLEALNQNSFKDYFSYVHADSAGADELNRLFDAVTVNETSFFRTMPQLNAFRFHMLPAIVQQQRNVDQPRIRLWSAGCSSGEEPYTLAMILHDVLGADIKRWKITIVGSDLSKEMLDKAREGRYGDYSVRDTSPRVKDRYFKITSDGRFELAPEIRLMVRFEQGNLVSEERPIHGHNMDVIFCRNVLIYFDAEAKKRAVDTFYQALRPNGYLVVGPSETLFSINRDFRMVHFNQAVGYQKS